MNVSKDTILIIDNPLTEHTDFISEMKSSNCEIKMVPKIESALNYLKKHPVSIVILNLDLKNSSPYHLLDCVKDIDPFLGVVYFSEHVTISDAIATIKRGADYVFDNNIDKKTLIKAINKLIEETHKKRQMSTIKKSQQKHITHNIVHLDTKMQQIMETVDQVALTKATVLLLGESGVGKEVFAKMIHKRSPRKHKRFVVINCAAIPENLIESELFGHEKGSFTGANYKKIGKFEQAQGGTIFLDEMGELSLDMQVKFLRVLQERQLERVGSSNSIEIDVRIIAATNRDLLSELDKGRFREDLYYRLNVFSIYIPPLRERKIEIPTMANLFINEFAKDYNKQLEIMDIETIHVLMEHNWKGNVRELRNVIERATVVAKKDEKILMVHHLPNEITIDKALSIGRNKTNLTLKEYERMIILYTMKLTNGSKSKAAEILDIQRQTLYNKLKEYKL